MSDRSWVWVALVAVAVGVVGLFWSRGCASRVAYGGRVAPLNAAAPVGRKIVKYAGNEGAGHPELARGTDKNAAEVPFEPASYGGAMVDAVEKSRRLKCRNNLRQIGLALFMYREGTDGQWPRDLETLVDRKYLTDRKVLQCPSARSPAGSVDYVLVKTTGKDGRPRTFDPNDIIVYDRKGNHADGRNVLLFNQETHWLSEEDFRKRMGNEPYE